MYGRSVKQERRIGDVFAKRRERRFDVLIAVRRHVFKISRTSRLDLLDHCVSPSFQRAVGGLDTVVRSVCDCIHIGSVPPQTRSSRSDTSPILPLIPRLVHLSRKRLDLFRFGRKHSRLLVPSAGEERFETFQLRVVGFETGFGLRREVLVSEVLMVGQGEWVRWDYTSRKLGWVYRMGFSGYDSFRCTMFAMSFISRS